MAEAMKDCSEHMRESVLEMRKAREFDNESGHTTQEVKYTG